MAFEKFQNKGAKPGESGTETPVISLRKDAAFGLSKASVELFFDEYDWVHFYYDEENNQIGIKPRNSKDEDTYQISKRDGTGTIKSIRFLSMYGLVPETSMRFEAKWNDEKGLVYINLDNPIETLD